MTNTIHVLQNLLGTTAVNGPKTGTNPKPETAGAMPAGVDQTSLSAGGDIVSKALKSVKETSDVRFDKVSALQNSIQNGTYHVPASDVADKILSTLAG